MVGKNGTLRKSFFSLPLLSSLTFYGFLSTFLNFTDPVIIAPFIPLTVTRFLFFVFWQWARKTMIKLVVDREYETSSTGEDSAPECQRNRLQHPGTHSNINGNIYIAQNGSVVRTRRACLPDTLKATSPVRLGRHFKKLDKLAVTHEENVPLNTLSKGPFSTEKMNTRPTLVTFAPCPVGPDGTAGKTLGPRLKSTVEQESMVDSKNIKGTPEFHSDHTHSDDEELWMGPWNNLHIPMTKL